MMTRDRKTMLDWTVKNMSVVSAKDAAQVVGYALDIFTHPTIYGDGQAPNEEKLKAALISCYKAVYSALPDDKTDSHNPGKQRFRCTVPHRRNTLVNVLCHSDCRNRI